MKQPIAIDCQHVSFSYQGQTVLEDITCQIEEGSYTGIVGPNGGGKTTLLKIILGILKPTKGSVELFGMPPLQARKAGAIGYVPQRIVQSDFRFPASVQEIVESGLTGRIGIGGGLDEEKKMQAEGAMTITGVLKFNDRLISDLSGGERQKVFIARALAGAPRMLILDEPTTGVDTKSQEEFYALLRMLHREQELTILFVSHDVEVMASEASSILCLNRLLVAHCSAHDFMHTPDAQKLYGRGVAHIHHHHS